MSESGLNSTETSNESVDTKFQVHEEVESDSVPAFQTIEIVETQENGDTQFVNESGSVEGTSNSDSESVGTEDVDEESDSDDNAKESKLTKVSVKDENDSQTNKDSEGDSSAAHSWPTLEILPGGVIRPTDNETPGSIFVDLPEASETSDDFMYACAKCPMKFRYLYMLTKHIRGHDDAKKKANNLDLIKLSDFEREVVALKREIVLLDIEHKRRKLRVMNRLATAIATIDPAKLL